MAVRQARHAPSPQRGEGWGEGGTIERLVPPHPLPLPVGERESRRARRETVDPNVLRIKGREPCGTYLRHLSPAKSEMLQQPHSLRTNRTVPEHPTILIFDSGLGGLTVFREVKAARPDACFIYVADDALFPYGAHGEAELVGRVVPLMGTLINEYRPALVVIACNTASTLVLPHLRERYELP